MQRGINFIKQVIREFGVDKVSALFSGEPLVSTDAWKLVDIARRYKYWVEYEDEEGDPPRCYVLVIIVDDKYIIVLARSHGESIAYMYEKQSVNMDETIRYAQKIFNECCSQL